MKRNNLFNHFLRNRISMLYGILLFSLLLGACVDEPVVREPDSEQGVKMYLRIPAQTITQTRAGGVVDDKYVDPTSVYVFVLSGNSDDSSHRVLQVVNAVAGSEGFFYAKLSENSNAKHVYVAANIKEIVERIGINNFNGMTLGVLKSQLSKTVAITGNVISEFISQQPMFGELSLPSGGITPETTIGTSGNPVVLVRTTSKISITNKASDGNFTLIGANLVNAPKLGYIVSGQPATGDRYPTGAGGDIEKMISTPTQGNEKETILYSFESAEKESQSTFVIIQTLYLGETHYYRLNLNNKASDYPLLRNHHYTVDILKINKKGYSTAAEASANPAANIEYVVNVVDETGRNIVSTNGYYLAVSQTEFYYFLDKDDEFTNQEVAIITHNAPSSIMSGSCTPSAGISITGGFATNNGGVQSFPLKVSMDKDTNEGTITLELGDLKREIKVYRRAVKEDFRFGDLFKEFVQKGYISGKVDKADESWIQLAATEELTGNNQFASLENKEGKIYIRVNAHLGDDSSQPYRYGAVDLFREDERGNARVLIKQPVYDVYTDIVGQAKIAPYTYVGTFHRSNQTGERIIRVSSQISGGNIARWRAFVILGDFVRISTTRSKDPGVGVKNFYGDAANGEAADNTTIFGDAVESYQVTDGKTDTGELQSDHIYFRVGLTSAIKSNTVRYGLIGLQINGDIGSKTITRYIFVRQGEVADYIMRPQDAVEQAPTQPARDLAVKISPFNLTDPSKTSDKLHSNLSNTAGVFADYPSQAGYLYQALSNQGMVAEALSLSKPAGWATGGGLKPTEHPWIATNYERCPSGYERPEGGKDHLEKSSAIVRDSPIRQSLWLYPKDGGISETQNFIVGYMADGFYDRQTMHTVVKLNSLDKNASNQPVAVNHKANIAYIGVLSFNPHNVASLFLPMNGYYRDSGGPDFYQGGLMGSFHTKTPVYQGYERSTNNYYTVDWGFMIGAEEPKPGGEMFRVDNYRLHAQIQAGNIRCVQKQ